MIVNNVDDRAVEGELIEIITGLWGGRGRTDLEFHSFTPN